MNIILFTESELLRPLPYSDRRSRHIRRILKLKEGDILKAGLVNGNRGTAIIEKMTAGSIVLTFRLNRPALPLKPIRIICGLPRPQQAKRILRDCASMGLSHLWFTPTGLGEKSYRDSPLWKNNAWQHCVYDGVEQSGGTMIPEVRLFRGLQECLSDLPAAEGSRFFLDIGAAEKDSVHSVTGFPGAMPPVTICVGPERGWALDERQFLLSHHFIPVTLGDHILRTDTACIAAAALASSFAYPADGSSPLSTN
jgi:16S rRNA (uracil1498-N3)-methyltransferase